MFCASVLTNSDDSVWYVLSQLGLSDLKLKNVKKQAIHVVYSGKDVCLLTGFGKGVWFEILPFLFNHKCGRIGRKKRSCAIIISQLVVLMVDKVRNLRKSGV